MKTIIQFFIQFLPFIMLINPIKDTSEYWRETEILSLVKNIDVDIDYEKCEKNTDKTLVHIPSKRTVRPICRGTYGKLTIYVYMNLNINIRSCGERRVVGSV